MSFRYPYTMGRAVALLNQGKVNVNSLIAERIPLERLAEILANGELRSRGKYMVDPWMA